MKKTLWFVLIVASISSVAWLLLPRRSSGVTQLEISVDGGYAMIHEKPRLKISSGFGHKELHEMRLFLVDGSIDGSSDLPPSGTPPMWNLEDYVTTVTSPAPTRDIAFKASGLSPGCVPLNVPGPLGLAHMTALHRLSGSGSDAYTLPASQFVVSSGILDVVRYRSCWVYAGDDGRVVQEPLAAGNGGMIYSLALPNSSVVLTFTRGHKTWTVKLKPAIGSTVVKLRLGRLDQKGEEIEVGKTHPHFDDFYGVFTDILLVHRLPIKNGTASVRAFSPGDECPPGFFEGGI